MFNLSFKTTFSVLTIKTRLFLALGSKEVKMGNQIPITLLTSIRSLCRSVFLCTKGKVRDRHLRYWTSSFVCVQNVLERSSEPGVFMVFTAQSVAFHSRLWLSSWPGPAMEAHPGLEGLELGGCWSSSPYPPALVWISPKNMTLITGEGGGGG